MYCSRVCVCVCPSVYLSVGVCVSCEQSISKHYEQILMKFCEVRHGPGRNWLDFGGDPDTLVYPGSFSRILHHQETGCKAYLSILWRGFNENFFGGWRSRSLEFLNLDLHPELFYSPAQLISLSVKDISSYSLKLESLTRQKTSGTVCLRLAYKLHKEHAKSTEPNTSSDQCLFVWFKTYQAADLMWSCVNDTGTDEVVRIWINAIKHWQSRSDQLQHITVRRHSIILLQHYS